MILKSDLDAQQTSAATLQLICIELKGLGRRKHSSLFVRRLKDKERRKFNNTDPSRPHHVELLRCQLGQEGGGGEELRLLLGAGWTEHQQDPGAHRARGAHVGAAWNGSQAGSNRGELIGQNYT